MATVKIGGRDLDVKPATVGFWERACETEKKKGADLVRAIVDLVNEAVGHNDGVTLDWIRDNLPFPPTAPYYSVLVAAGIIDAHAEPKPGEAATQ